MSETRPPAHLTPEVFGKSYSVGHFAESSDHPRSDVRGQVGLADDLDSKGPAER